MVIHLLVPAVATPQAEHQQMTTQENADDRAYSTVLDMIRRYVYTVGVIFWCERNMYSWQYTYICAVVVRS